ncbi:MAG TPA: DNA-directed RNA polymerase subunit delta [Symbiobacteriaceae bacterium]
MSVTDIAWTILKNRGKPVHFKELIEEVMQVKAINREKSGKLIAQMHTEISLDSRFIHYGNGEWGLREWQNKGNKVIRIRPETPPAPTPPHPHLRLHEDLEQEEELEEDLLDSDLDADLDDVFDRDDTGLDDDLPDLYEDDEELPEDDRLDE